MTVYIDLQKTTPESVVDQLIRICQDSAACGGFVSEPVHVEFKTKSWLVTWTNNFGKFSERFKSEDTAVQFLVDLHKNMGVKESSIRMVQS